MGRKAEYGDVLAFAESALSAPSGVKVTAPSLRIAENIQMQFYAKRKECQDAGDNRFDSIKIRRRGREVLFFRELEGQPLKVEIV